MHKKKRCNKNFISHNNFLYYIYDIFNQLFFIHHSMSDTDSYRILPILTAFYRNLLILTDFYRFLPIKGPFAVR